MNKNLLKFLSIIIGTLVFTVFGIVYVINRQEVDALLVIVASLVLLITILSIVYYLKHRKDSVEGDELTLRLFQISASRSFIISFYSWVFLFLFQSMFTSYSTLIVIGLGIMLGSFIINYLILLYWGVKNY